jgi:hypothetical protein
LRAGPDGRDRWLAAASLLGIVETREPNGDDRLNPTALLLSARAGGADDVLLGGRERYPLG